MLPTHLKRLKPYVKAVNDRAFTTREIAENVFQAECSGHISIQEARVRDVMSATMLAGIVSQVNSVLATPRVNVANGATGEVITVPKYLPLNLPEDPIDLKWIYIMSATYADLEAHGTLLQALAADRHGEFDFMREILFDADGD